MCIAVHHCAEHNTTMLTHTLLCFLSLVNAVPTTREIIEVLVGAAYIDDNIYNNIINTLDNAIYTQCQPRSDWENPTGLYSRLGDSKFLDWLTAVSNAFNGYCTTARVPLFTDFLGPSDSPGNNWATRPQDFWVLAARHITENADASLQCIMYAWMVHTMQPGKETCQGPLDPAVWLF
jgi:hypothetical protein